MMTVAELCAWGIPSLLIPLPTAAADHQTPNARVMDEAGAAIHLPQPRVPGRLWGGIVPELLQSPEPTGGHGPGGAGPGPARRGRARSRLVSGFFRGNLGLSQVAVPFYIRSSAMNLFLPSDPRPLHFVGIGGAGMSALAVIAL